MQGWRLVHIAIQDVVELETGCRFGARSMLLADDKKVRFLGILHLILHARRQSAACNVDLVDVPDSTCCRKAARLL